MQWLVPLRSRLVRGALLIALYLSNLPLAAIRAEAQLDLCAHISKDPPPGTPLQRWLAGVPASAPEYDSSVPPSTPSGSAAPPEHPGFSRMLRRSRDGGVRLAGDSPFDYNANVFSPGEYDQMLEVMTEGSTLPPEYQPYSLPRYTQ